MIASHVTIAVSDLERSERFYAILGFQRQHATVPGDAFKALLEQPVSAGLAMVAVRGDGMRLELLRIDPSPSAPLSAPPGLGLRHLALRVDNIDKAAAEIAVAGGAVLPQTATTTVHGRFLMCADPDGLRLLLIESAAR